MIAGLLKRLHIFNTVNHLCRLMERDEGRGGFQKNRSNPANAGNR